VHSRIEEGEMEGSTRRSEVGVPRGEPEYIGRGRERGGSLCLHDRISSTVLADPTAVHPRKTRQPLL
jgi:hypothetical protein